MKRASDLINEREVLLDYLFAVGAVEVGLRWGRQGETAVAKDENEPASTNMGSGALRP